MDMAEQRQREEAPVHADDVLRKAVFPIRNPNHDDLPCGCPPRLLASATKVPRPIGSNGFLIYATRARESLLQTCIYVTEHVFMSSAHIDNTQWATTSSPGDNMHIAFRNSLLAGILFFASSTFIAAQDVPDEVKVAGIDLLDASHILHFLGVVDALGHVSVRNPANASQFLMTFSIAPAQATSKSIVTYEIENATAVSLTFNSSVTGASVPTGFSERFIHSEILKAFPDVLAVVHGHTEEVLPFANQASVPLVAQIHTAGALGSEGAPIFDTAELPRSILPDNQLHDLLVRNELLGDALARKFSNDSQVVLMRGHGMVVRGTSIRDAVFRSYYVKQNAAAQFQGILLGGGRPPKSLSRREATDASTTDDGLVGRAWSLWAQQADNAGLYVNDLRNGSAPPPT